MPRRRGSGSPGTPRSRRSVAAGRTRRGRRRPRTFDTGKRLVGLGVVIGVVACGLIVRTAWVGSIHRDEYSELGAERRSFTREVDAPRGSIVDRNGESLVMSIPSDLVAVDPTLVEDPETVATTLAAMLDLDRRDVLALATDTSREYREVARDLPPDVGDRVRDLELAGVIVDRRPKRERIGGDIGLSLVGQMDAYGDQALSGLEKLYDTELSSTPGELHGERDAENDVIPGTERVLRSARAGSDVWLTIDRPLQYVAEQALIDQLDRVGAHNATVVMGRTKTSEILAMASVTRDGDGVAVVDSLNQAGREYEPGSVMKMVTVAAAYDMGVVQPSSTLAVPGSITLGDYTITDHDPNGGATLTVDQILAQSSNVGTIKIAQTIGKDSLVDYLGRFGFGQMSPLGLLKEQSGVIRENWNASDIGSIPIGQGITVTPLQMWAAYNVVANGGIYVPPRLVADIVDAEGTHDVPDVGEPRRVISKSAAAKVNHSLQEVIEEGTGKQWQIDGFRIAAKTGTAYKPLENGQGYGTKDTRTYRSSFVGYFPATDPEISIMVMIDEPKPPLHLGTVAAGPVFDALAKEGMRRYAIAGDDIPPDRGPVRADAAVRRAPAPDPGDVTPEGVDSPEGVDAEDAEDAAGVDPDSRSTSTVAPPPSPRSTSPPDDESSAAPDVADERGPGDG